jgi:hypothetical protein
MIVKYGATKVLFILKRKQNYDTIKDSHLGMSTGLYNSASFMCDMLNENGIGSKISVVLDNNDIDREVTQYKPTHVIIEALWVVPTKFAVLTKLHPKVKWIIRLHSDLPFLANEGNAIDWLGDYVGYKKVFIGTNAPKITRELKEFLKNTKQLSEKKIEKKIIYLPNYYPQDYVDKKFECVKDTIDISCFGAVRPLKNHLVQAFAAIKFANFIGKKLRFHINSGRIEQKGDSVYKNLEGLFSHISESGHQLINHPWCPREQFLEICAKMDIGMQVSFSETFNIVSADLISQGVPMVTSDEIPWSFKLFTSKPTSSSNIFFKLLLTYFFNKINLKTNRYLLTRYTNKSKNIWLNYFKMFN